jgi:hypothetical protein
LLTLVYLCLFSGWFELQASIADMDDIVGWLGEEAPHCFIGEQPFVSQIHCQRSPLLRFSSGRCQYAISNLFIYVSAAA